MSEHHELSERPDQLHEGCSYFAWEFPDGLFCPKCGWSWSAWPGRVDAEKARADAAEAKLAAIDALHSWRIHRGTRKPVCRLDGESWPCPTHRILHPDTKEGS